jgi:hypothetical protein
MKYDLHELFMHPNQLTWHCHLQLILQLNNVVALFIFICEILIFILLVISLISTYTMLICVII